MTTEHQAVGAVMQMVQHLCMRYGWQYEVQPGKPEANVMVRLMDGSLQKVCIFGRKDINGQPVIVFYTGVIPSNVLKDPLALLRENWQLNHCHFAIVKNMVVVLDTQLLMTADYPEVAKKIENVALQGEGFQKRFRGGWPF